MNISEDEIQISFQDFYFRLLDNQESMGIEFESIVNENLWDLYEE